jgi:hypothetical protein
MNLLIMLRSLTISVLNIWKGWISLIALLGVIEDSEPADLELYNVLFNIEVVVKFIFFNMSSNVNLLSLILS